MFTEIHNTRTYEKIIEQIKENIKNKNLQKGDKLPPERLMAEQMGVSRLTIREALSYLIAIGLVENKPGSGNYIKSDLSNLLYESLYMYILLEGIDFNEILLFRKTLQIQCIDTCIDNITSENLNELETICNELNSCKNYHDLVLLDIKFHYYIVEISNKKMINMVYNSISELVKEHISHTLKVIFEDKNKLEKLLNLHFKIFNAIKNKDKECAIKAMQEHFNYLENIK